MLSLCDSYTYNLRTNEDFMSTITVCHIKYTVFILCKHFTDVNIHCYIE
jgi:hypothetical protein